MMNKDLYQILGVSKTATEAQIKSAYRKLARQYHPAAEPLQRNHPHQRFSRHDPHQHGDAIG